jgi:hypothetical protein
MLRRFLLLAAVCATAGVLGRPASAAPNHSVNTTNFTVWYDSDPNQNAYATYAQASNVANLAERALAAQLSWGFDAPVPAMGGKQVITIADLSNSPGVIYQLGWGAAVPPTYALINLAKTELDSPRLNNDIGSLVMAMIAARYWIPSFGNRSEDWLLTGPTAWAGFKVDGYASPGQIGPSSMPLDCHDTNNTLQMCSSTAYVNGGDSRWPFYEFLAQKYGTSFLKSVWQQAELSGAVNGLAAAISASGGGLADTVNDYAVRAMTRGWNVKPLDSLTPQVTGSAVSTGTVTGVIATTTVSVDHLASKILAFTRGDGHGEHACFAASLTVNVTLPNGVASSPYWYWSRDAAAQPLAVSGTSATITVPWDTCKWSSTDIGYLVLPNDSTNVDAATFTVSGSLAVDETKPATPGADPTPVPVSGPVVPVPTEDVPPAIAVSGPFLLRVSATSPTLRLIVQANGEGAVRGTLGTVDLGSVHIRPGGNDVRFKLPKSLLSALRRSSASGASLLTLTPVSASGTVTGTAVTRRVTVLKK